MDLTLFNNYYDAGNYLDAYLVVRNMYSKDTANAELFEKFFSLGKKLALLDIAFPERKNYLNEISSALSVFSDNAVLTEEVVFFIKACQRSVAEIYNAIMTDEQEHMLAFEDEIYEANNLGLQQLGEILEKIKNAINQKAFDELLNEISEIEEAFVKSKFTETQRNSYEKLSKYFSASISKKMEELNRLELLEVNKKAIASYKQVFEKYTANKEKYKDNESNLKALVYDGLFLYDSRDLFNESLIYYNHVYSMIFNEVTDKLKYKLTEWSIEATKNK